MKNLANKILYRICQEVIGKHNGLMQWYYAEKVKKSVDVLGYGVRINGRIDIMYPRGLLIGNNVHIGKGAHIDARAGVIIGDHTHISRNVTIYSTNHNYEGKVIPYDETLIPGRVIIGEGVWIGMNVCITPGVTIGKGAIIGMGSVVSKDVGEGEIVVSNTQRVIGTRDLDAFREKHDKFLIGGVSGKVIHKDKKINFKTSLLPDSNKGENLVFVLSTGRSGSNALAKILEQDPNVVSYHEPLYVLLKILCTKYLCGKINKEEVRQQLVNYYSTIPLSYRGKIYLESDQKLVPFLDVLMELFPKAKFIWLIRDPFKFALSATSRGWFSSKDKIYFFKDNPLIDRRLSSEGQRNYIDYINVFQKEGLQTEDLTSFEKNVLYWKLWNGLIYDEFLKINQKNRLFVRLEKLDEQIKVIQEFVGVNPSQKIYNKKTNKVKKVDRDKYEENKKKINELITSCRIDISKEKELWYSLYKN